MYLKEIVCISLILAACGRSTDNVVEEGIVETPTSLPYYDAPDFTPIWNPEKPDTLHMVSDFSFVNQFGDSVTSKTVEDKIYVVNFFFSTCAGICPKMMRNMQNIHNSFADEADVALISHTVMPWADSVPVLKNYSQLFRTNTGEWHFVTGDKAHLYDIARRSYFVEEEPGFTKDSSEFLHTEHFVLVDRHKHLRGIYNGTLELEMTRLSEDIELLLNEENK
jgi:protein SCO1/2